MKIAFDVQDTLIGNKTKEVLDLYKEYESMGYEMIVWSSHSIPTIKDLIEPLNIYPHKIASKLDAMEIAPNICVDDDERFLSLCKDLFGSKTILIN